MQRSFLAALVNTTVYWLPLMVLAVSVRAEKVSVVLTFHDDVLVNDTVFTVGDIADISGGTAATVENIRKRFAGTSAPPGYSRFLSSADFVACRLAATFPEATFTIAGSPRPQIRTDYRTVTLEEYQSAIQAYVDSTIGWQAGEWSMDIMNPNDSCKCLNGPVTVSVDGLSRRFPKGNENLTLQVHQGARTFRLQVRCRFSVQCRVLVAKSEIARGAVLSINDCEFRTTDITRFAPSPLTSTSALQEMRAARTIKPGTILHNRLLVKIPVIEKGEAVSIVYKKGRFSIAVAGVARESGGKGDRIWVENCTTHKLLHVEVKEKGKVHALVGGVSI